MNYTFTGASGRIGVLKSSRETLLDYMDSKVHLEDWHAVSDAANDLREIDLEIQILNSMLPQLMHLMLSKQELKEQILKEQE